MVIHSTKDNARDIPINSDVLKEAFNTIIDNIDYEDFEGCETEEQFKSNYRKRILQDLDSSGYQDTLYQYWLVKLSEITKNDIKKSEIESLARETVIKEYQRIKEHLQQVKIPESAIKAWQSLRTGKPLIPEKKNNRVFPTKKEVLPIATSPPSRTTLRGVMGGSKVWKSDEFGIAEYLEHYQSIDNFKSPVDEMFQENYIRMNIAIRDAKETENVVIRLWDEAKEILDRLGPEAALLHIYLTAQCLTNQNPFQDPFILNADDILKELGWDKRKRLKRHEKLLKLKQIAFALGSLYQTVRWRTQKRINGKNRLVDLSHEGLVWIIDFFSETQVRLFPEDPEEIIRLAISVKPGIWAEKFLNQKGYIKGTASNEYGYMSGLITQIDPYHDDLAFRIALFLTIENRINNDGDYYVKTLLKLKYSDDDLTEATKTNKSNRVLAKTIRNNWEQALARLHQLGYKIKALDNYPNWLRPDFLQDDVYQPDGKQRKHLLTQLLKAKVQIFQPDTIPEKLAVVSQRKKAHQPKVLQPASKPKSEAASRASKPKAKLVTPADIREARKRKGWSQRKLAGVLGISQALVAYYENGERKPTPETLRSLKKVLDLD